jgi:hypothetical protein
VAVQKSLDHPVAPIIAEYHATVAGSLKDVQFGFEPHRPIALIDENALPNRNGFVRIAMQN